MKQAELTDMGDICALFHRITNSEDTIAESVITVFKDGIKDVHINKKQSSLVINLKKGYLNKDKIKKLNKKVQRTIPLDLKIRFLKDAIKLSYPCNSIANTIREKSLFYDRYPILATALFQSLKAGLKYYSKTKVITKENALEIELKPKKFSMKYIEILCKIFVTSMPTNLLINKKDATIKFVYDFNVLNEGNLPVIEEVFAAYVPAIPGKLLITMRERNFHCTPDSLLEYVNEFGKYVNCFHNFCIHNNTLIIASTIHSEKVDKKFIQAIKKKHGALVYTTKKAQGKYFTFLTNAKNINWERICPNSITARGCRIEPDGTVFSQAEFTITRNTPDTIFNILEIMDLCNGSKLELFDGENGCSGKITSQVNSKKQKDKKVINKREVI